MESLVVTSLCIWHSCFILSSCSLLKLQSGVCCLLAVVGCSRVLGIILCSSKTHHCIGLLFRVAWWIERWCCALDQMMHSKTLQWHKSKLWLSFIFILSVLIWCFFLFATVINHLLCSSEFLTWFMRLQSLALHWGSAVHFWVPHLDTFQAACSGWGCLVQPLLSSVTGSRLCSSLCYPDAYQLLSSPSPCLAAVIKAPLFLSSQSNAATHKWEDTAAQVSVCQCLPRRVWGQAAHASCIA